MHAGGERADRRPTGYGDRVEPSTPDAETRELLLAELADLVARAGWRGLLAEPVAPSAAAFPERWERTPDGVVRLLRRLAWHAGIERAIAVVDERWGAPPTERKPATAIEVTRATQSEAHFTIGFIGEDDVAGTLAHELGVLFAMLHRRDGADPYRAAAAPLQTAVDPDRDLERGSIATVALGLGVLAANAAFQQYSGSGRFNGAYVPLEYDVLRAGHLPMAELAFLLAVQAVVRGEAEPPVGLAPPQRDEVAAWLPHLDRRALRERLGIPADATGVARPLVGALDVSATTGTSGAATQRLRDAFRYRSHRGGIGLVAGTMLGVGVTVMMATRVPLFVLAGASGHVVGRRIRVCRCTACVSIVPDGAPSCRSCGAKLRGDIADPADRLEAEEELAERPRSDGAIDDCDV